MDVLYEIVFLYAPSQEVRARSLERAIRDELPDPMKRFGTLPIAFSHNTTPSIGSREDPVLRLAVFLADTEAPNATVIQLVADWQGIETLVIPVYTGTGSFKRVTPESLHAINPLKWPTGLTDPGTLTVTALLRLIGLVEERRKIFLSYKRSDSQPIVDQLFQELVAMKFSVFLDWVNIEPGVPFQKRLMSELESNAMVLLLESPNVKQSKWVTEEVTFAIKNKLGLLALTWPEVAADSRLQVKVIPDSYRCPIGPMGAALSDGQIETALKTIERVHAQAMARRRKELLGSIFKEAESRNVTLEWAGPWRLLMKTPDNGEVVQWDVVPRPAEPEDLYTTDEHRRQQQRDLGLVVHSGYEFQDNRHSLLSWAAHGNQVIPVAEKDLSAMLDDLVNR